MSTLLGLLLAAGALVLGLGIGGRWERISPTAFSNLMVLASALLCAVVIVGSVG